jgi:hypothetical protein
VFFIPVLTPRYFRSEPCREEFRAFVGKARQIGITERVLSLIYINVPDLHMASKDELKVWAATYQHEPIYRCSSENRALESGRLSSSLRFHGLRGPVLRPLAAGLRPPLAPSIAAPAYGANRADPPLETCAP